MSFKNHRKVNECLLLTRSDTATWNNGSLFWQKVEVPPTLGLEGGGGGNWGTHPASVRPSTGPLVGPGFYPFRRPALVLTDEAERTD